jgi:hypothetical protein
MCFGSTIFLKNKLYALKSYDELTGYDPKISA